MRNRDQALPIPSDKLPFFTVVCGGVTYYLRVPSLLQVAELGKAIEGDERRALMGLALAMQRGAPLPVAAELARQGGSEILALAGALIGVAWRDPVVALEVPQPGAWTPEHARAYGRAVYEDLHDGGWTFSHVLNCALALFEQISANVTLEQEVLERAAFLGRSKGLTTDGSSSPNASSSEGGSAPSGVGS